MGRKTGTTSGRVGGADATPSVEDVCTVAAGWIGGAAAAFASSAASAGESGTD